MNPALTLGLWMGERGTVRPDAVEVELAEFDQHQVDEDHRGEGGEEARG
jgi:hypothetical protein